MSSVASFLERQALRLEARWSHWSLDASLALGADPAEDPVLAARAAQLCSSRHRGRLAAWIERLVRESDTTPRGVSAAHPIAGEQVRAARESLLLLARRLRGAGTVQPRAVAIVKRLLTHGGSVIYTNGARGALELQVQMALGYLVGEPRAAQEDASALSSASETPAGRPRLTQTA
jgi:hypothetical protein